MFLLNVSLFDNHQTDQDVELTKCLIDQLTMELLLTMLLSLMRMLGTSFRKGDVVKF